MTRIRAGVGEQLRLAVLAADDRMHGLELEQLAVNGAPPRRPAAAKLPAQAPWTAASRG